MRKTSIRGRDEKETPGKKAFVYGNREKTSRCSGRRLKKGRRLRKFLLGRENFGF